jgi:hypothetical protein
MITNYVNYILYFCEIQRDYRKAAALSTQFADKVDKAERLEKDRCEKRHESFSMLAAAKLGLQLLRRNARVMDSDILVLAITFDRQSFRKIQQKLAESFPNEVVGKTKREKHRHREQKVPSPNKRSSDMFCGCFPDETPQFEGANAFANDNENQ